MKKRIQLIIATVCFVFCSKIGHAMEGQVFIVTQRGQNVKLGLVNISIHPTKEVEDYIAMRKTVVVPIADRLDTEAKNLAQAGKLRDAIVRIEQSLALFRSFFDEFDRSGALARTKTDADGRFRLTTPSRQDVVLLATAERRVGDEIESYIWILPPGEWEDPMFLSNDNKFSLHLNYGPELLSGDKAKVREFRNRPENRVSP